MKSDKVYKPEEIKDVLKMVRPYFRFAYKQGVRYFNVPCSFDIETTSFYETDEDIYLEPDLDVYNYIKGHILKYTDSIKSDIPDFDDIRKSHFGSISFAKTKGTPIDTVYKELSQLYPYYFPEDVYAVADMLDIIIDVFDSNKPIPRNTQPDKVATMYVWQFGIFGTVIVGRTWEEFITMLDVLSHELCLDDKKRLIIYVHNLSFEFAFFARHMLWKKVFAVSSREPVYALTIDGIEFRCSYILSGYSLAKLGDELHKYKVQKLVGELDYTKIRHSKTPLTDKELAYCVNDVKVVMAFIMESIESDGDIARIPLTKTGYARKYVRNTCWYTPGVKKDKDFKRLHYTEFIKALTIEPDEYLQMKRGFAGGFTHGNPFCVGKIIEDVTSYDFTSSYPYVMVSEQFPMSKGELVQITSKEDFEKNLRCYWCLFDIEFIGLEPRLTFENYISRSRCTICEGSVLDNGRVVSAARLITTITGEDYDIIIQFYSWAHIRVFNFRRYKKAYLPTDFVKAILKLYSDKTTLKGVKGKEVEYQVAKGLLNSCYGMTCTDIVRPENIYDGAEWSVKDPDLNKMIDKYNRSSSRFLFYPWGVAICAYARRNLFTGILEFKEDYCYADTDSIKVKNVDDHMDYINRYNEDCIRKLHEAMDYHGLPYELIEPETIKGEKKPLGVWDFDGHYTRFKTLGAKRYMVEYDTGDISITVSGLNKKVAGKYLTEKYGSEVFEHFTNDLYVPPDYTGKLTHTYIDEERQGYITDYQGVTSEYHELSCVHLSKQDYSLSISREFADYLSSLVYL